MEDLEIQSKLFVLEKFDIEAKGRMDLLEQRIVQMKEGFDHSRATGSRAWDAVGVLKEALAKESERVNALTKDLNNALEKIKRIEADLREKIEDVSEDAGEAKGDFKDINKILVWGLVSAIVLFVTFGAASYLVKRFGG